MPGVVVDRGADNHDPPSNRYLSVSFRLATALIALGLILDVYSVIMIIMVRRQHKKWASPIIAIPFLLVGIGILLHPMPTSTAVIVVAAAACFHALCAFAIPRWLLPRLF